MSNEVPGPQPEPAADRAQAADEVLAEEAAGGSSGSRGTEIAAAVEIERLQGELQQANDRALRAQAELENFRRRLRREMEDERKYAALSLFSDLLGVVDNLERALTAAEKDEASSALRQGVTMIQSLLLSVFDRHQCRRIGAVGVPFDPNEHQAIAQEASAELPAGTVSRVAQYGYRLHDRVVRPAQVFVSTGAPAPASPNA